MPAPSHYSLACAVFEKCAGPLDMIAAWRRGCPCADPGKPEQCQACTLALIQTIERALTAPVLANPR